MTHDEILTRIAKLSITPETNVVPSELATALMAVVELHKPYSGLSGATCTCDPYNEYLMGYPCDTIQAIEKELK
jgi:hypothetical protein